MPRSSRRKSQPPRQPRSRSCWTGWKQTSHTSYSPATAAASLNLDQRPEASTWVRSSWETFQALEAYAAAQAANGFAGDFKTWCESPPSGECAIPAGKVVRDESETVRNNARWHREREFPVPPGICASGRVFMGAHVRIGASAGGQISPRLYFHDGTGQTGLIYVGYLGRHLTNTRT